MSVKDLADGILALPSGIHYIGYDDSYGHHDVLYEGLILRFCRRTSLMKHKWQAPGRDCVKYYHDERGVCIINGYGLYHIIFARIQVRHFELVIVLHCEIDDFGIRITDDLRLDLTHASKQLPCHLGDMQYISEILHNEIQEKKAIAADLDDIILELNSPPSKRSSN